MRKALVTLTKRILVDSANSGEFRKLFEDTYSKTNHSFNRARVDDYSVFENQEFPAQGIAMINNIPTLELRTAIINGLRFIPNLTDTSKRLRFFSSHEEKKYWGEVVNYKRDSINSFQIALYFKTDFLILLDANGDNLLLCKPNKIGENDVAQKDFRDTFFLKLSDDLYFSDYTPL